MKRVCAVLCLSLVGCTGSAPDREGSQPGQDIVAGARRALGIDGPSDGFGVIADATVTGPGGQFRTIVMSAADGRARMEQCTGFLAGVDAHGPWTIDGTIGTVTDLSDDARAVLHGHEVHMLAIYPETRTTSIEFIGTVRFASTQALALRHVLSTGHELLAYYSPADTLPLGFEVTWLDPPVRVKLTDWSSGPQARLFRGAEFRQSDEIFMYVYDRLVLGILPDSAFERPKGSARPEVR